MHLDVTLLRDFYYGAPLGKLAQQRLQIALGEIWPSVSGLSVAGFGFAAPFLRPWRREAARTLALMPAGQGVIQWPREGPNVATLCGDYAWPLRTGFLDRLLLAHGLEAAERPVRLLDECWRVLAPEGRLLVIAPNRSGLWARRDGTPFGFGRPYSVDQLRVTLDTAGFDVGRCEGALFFPPSGRRYWHRAANTAERLGKRLDLRRLAGVLIVEAVKRVPGPSRGRVAPVMAPAAAPTWSAPAPA